MSKLLLKKYLVESDCADFANRKGFFLVISTAENAVSYTDRYLPRSSYIGVSQNEQLHFFNPLDNKIKPFQKILRRYWKNPQLLYSQYLEALETLNKFKKNVTQSNKHFSTTELLNSFSDYCAARYAAIRGINVLRKIDLAMQNYLQSHCAYLSPNDLVQLSYPDKNTVVIEEIKAILKAAAFYKRQPSVGLLNRLSQNIYLRYAAITIGWHKEKPRQLRYYQQKIVSWSKKHPEFQQKLFEKERKEHLHLRILASHKVKRRDKSLLTLLPAFPFLKDAYKLLANQANFYFQPVFTTMSKLHKIKVDDLWRLGVDEVKEMIIKKRIPWREIKERKKLYVYYSLHGVRKKFYGQSAKKFIKNFYQKEKKLALGRTASSGYGCGVARIVMSQNDFLKVKKGNILVVNNTTPDYVPIMQKVAAIVAEEGGITAHVCIVSRELKIPCIVGIKNATAIFHDGDMVEVDANKGVVKIIKRSKDE